MRQALAGGLAPQTVNHARAVLRSALADAQRWGTVARNAAALAEPLEVSATRAAAMRPEEARAILEAFRDTELEAVVGTALYLGMRQGEILGLRWNDVDLERKVLRVTGALHRIPRDQRSDPEVLFKILDPRRSGLGGRCGFPIPWSRCSQSSGSGSARLASASDRHGTSRSPGLCSRAPPVIPWRRRG